MPESESGRLQMESTDSPEVMAEQLASEDSARSEEVQTQRERTENGNTRGISGKGAEKRIDKLTKEKYQALETAKQLRERLARYEQVEELRLTPQERRKLEGKAAASGNGHQGTMPETRGEREIIERTNQPEAEQVSMEPDETLVQGEPELSEADIRMLQTHHENVTKLVEADPELKARAAELTGDADVEFLPDVTDSIYGAKNSAEVVAYLVKNHEIAEQIAAADPEQGRAAIADISRALAGEYRTERKAGPEAGKQGRERAEAEMLSRLGEHIKSLPESETQKFKDRKASANVQNVIRAVMLEMEPGEPERLAVYLLQNPQEVEKLDGMKSPAAVSTYLGKISARLEASQAKPAVPLSKAPQPIKPLTGHGVRSAQSIEDPELPYQEFKKLRENGGGNSTSRDFRRGRGYGI
jgi:hypothetical protein